MPGPREPPCSSRPSRKMTALSYSCTTLKQTNSEKGNVTITNPQEIIVSSQPHRPIPGSDSLGVHGGILSVSSCARSQQSASAFCDVMVIISIYQQLNIGD